MAEMSKTEIRRFLMRGTFTGKLATVKKDGSSHVVPIWFMLDVVDDGDSTSRIGDIVFTTASRSVKAKNIQREKRVSICIDDQKPPFSFVTIFGAATIYPYIRKEVLKWATKIAGRYMGKSNAKAYGERNSGEGEVLVRIKPKSILAEKHITSWDS
jgi:PPOX class probable F420-dependent enzyme